MSCTQGYQLCHKITGGVPMDMATAADVRDRFRQSGEAALSSRMKPDYPKSGATREIRTDRLAISVGRLNERQERDRIARLANECGVVVIGVISAGGRLSTSYEVEIKGGKNDVDKFRTALQARQQ